MSTNTDDFLVVVALPYRHHSSPSPSVGQEYNDNCREVRDLEQLSADTKVSWAATPRYGPFKSRDFVTAVHYRRLEDGTLMVLNRPVEHPLARYVAKVGGGRQPFGLSGLLLSWTPWSLLAAAAAAFCHRFAAPFGVSKERARWGAVDLVKQSTTCCFSCLYLPRPTQDLWQPPCRAGFCCVGSTAPPSAP